MALSTSTSRETEGGVPLLRDPRLQARSDLRHGFTTRVGGVSEGGWGPLSLAAHPEQPASHLVENWRRALNALGGPGLERLAVLSQVHGARVVEVRMPGGPVEAVAEADGAWTTQEGLVLAVRTADCVPVLFAGPGAIGVAHAGWRGTAAGVVPETVAAICAGVGCAADALTAVVGPCISGAAYEVGDEVVQALLATGLAATDVLVDDAGPRPHVDLGRAVLAQLRDCGVGDRRRLAACTWSESHLHSHRRDGLSSGRQAGLIVRCA